jgi:hypothetical protein
VDVAVSPRQGGTDRRAVGIVFTKAISTCTAGRTAGKRHRLARPCWSNAHGAKTITQWAQSSATLRPSRRHRGKHGAITSCMKRITAWHRRIPLLLLPYLQRYHIWWRPTCRAGCCLQSLLNITDPGGCCRWCAMCARARGPQKAAIVDSAPEAKSVDICIWHGGMPSSLRHAAGIERATFTPGRPRHLPQTNCPYAATGDRRLGNRAIAMLHLLARGMPARLS